MIMYSKAASVKLEGFDKELPFIYEYIPSVHIEHQPKKKDAYDAKLQVIHNNKFHLDLKYPAGRIQSDNDIETIALAEHMLERARQDRSIYCVHANAVSHDSKGVIIFGNLPDIGKTMLSFKLSKEGFVLLGDEKILMRENEIVGGIDYINMRKEWQKSYASGVVKSEKIFRVGQTANISLFVVPYIDNGKTEVKQWPAEKFFWHLQEELSRKIRGNSRLINNQTGLAPSLDTDALAKTRVAYAKRIALSVPCFAMRGKLEEMVTEIKGLI